MKKVEITIRPTEVRSVNYNNNFTKKAGQTFNISIRHEVGIKVRADEPNTASVFIKTIVADEDSNCLNVEIETITTVISNTFVGDLEEYIRRNYMPVIKLCSIEKVHAVFAVLGTPLRLPSTTINALVDSDEDEEIEE